MKRNRLTQVLAVAALACATATMAAEEQATADPPPDGVEQLLPRGRIAAVFEPEYVPASEAEIADDAWVLGVLIDGEAKAFSLNLLNRHEVVNDRSGETDFAAVW